MKQVIAFTVLVAILLLSADAFAASDHLEYNINIENAGSASWRIVHVTDIDSLVDSWEEFEERLFYIINTARDNTARDMALDLTSLEMSTQINWETSSKTIVYIFRWLNFSVIEQGQISFGDVLDDNFFPLLYGDGELYVTYPAEYVLDEVSFQPNQLDDSTQTLHWYRTQDFSVGDQSVLLVAKAVDSNEVFNMFTVAVLGSGGFCAAIGFFVFKQRRRQKEKMLNLDEFPLRREVESDQEKILQLLQSSGGNLKQSEVCDKLGFSRAKTSLLLAEMEKNSLVRRCKKGKNKIVFPIKNEDVRSL